MGADKEITVEIFDQYEKGTHYKASLGALGLFEQSDINEHFFIGDQWYNADCKSLRPLVRHNIIQRIGNYKMSLIASAPVSVNFSAEGVPNTVGQGFAERLHFRHGNLIYLLGRSDPNGAVCRRGKASAEKRGYRL